MDPDRRELWWLGAAPAIWVAHFGLTYAAVAVWCAKLAPADGALGPLVAVWAAMTVPAVAGLGGIGARAYRRYRQVPPDAPDADSAPSRHRFVALLTALSAGLAGVGILYVGSSFALVGSCS